MRGCLLIITITCLLISCGFPKENTELTSLPSPGLRGDTTVVDRVFEGGHEYFLVIKKDSSHFSLFADSNSLGQFVLKFTWVHERLNPNDSSAIIENTLLPQPCTGRDFRAQLREMELLLQRAFSDFNYRKVSIVRIGLQDVHGFSEIVTKSYNLTKSGRGKRGGKIILKKEVLEIVRNSWYFFQLEHLLLKHNLRIGQVEIDGLAYCSVADSGLLDGVILLKINPLPENSMYIVF